MNNNQKSIFTIKKDMAQDFIKECNDKVISKEFIIECKQAAKIFKRK